MVAEVNDGGGWQRLFRNRDFRDRFNAPTVVGVDFPTIGLCQAWNDPKEGTLLLCTYAATPSKRGTSTRFRVVRVPATGSCGERRLPV